MTVDPGRASAHALLTNDTQYFAASYVRSTVEITLAGP